jgi:hypothetical protein
MQAIFSGNKGLVAPGNIGERRFLTACAPHASLQALAEPLTGLARSSCDVRY